MDIDIQNVLIFVHVLLFGYWLGSDLGVFYCDSQLTRDDLSLDERLRVRQIRRKVDMAPRTCVALILPIGFSLAVQYGSPITGWWLALIWVLSLGWLVSLWAVRLTVDSAIGRTIDKYDRLVWYSVAIAMVGLGIYTLITGDVITESWLATKIFLYGLMVVSGRRSRSGRENPTTRGAYSHLRRFLPPSPKSKYLVGYSYQGRR